MSGLVSPSHMDGGKRQGSGSVADSCRPAKGQLNLRLSRVACYKQLWFGISRRHGFGLGLGLHPCADGVVPKAGRLLRAVHDWKCIFSGQCLNWQGVLSGHSEWTMSQLTRHSEWTRPDSARRSDLSYYLNPGSAHQPILFVGEAAVQQDCLKVLAVYSASATTIAASLHVHIQVAALEVSPLISHLIVSPSSARYCCWSFELATSACRLSLPLEIAV